MTEKNLIEIGISIIHERKKILRQIKQLKNHSYSNYGHIIVKYYDGTLQIERSLRFKITESKIKVKHILVQAYQILKQKKCDLQQYCLIQTQNSETKAILPNNTLIVDLINPYRIEEFLICKTSQFTQEREEVTSTCSPIRILRPDIDNSLERLINSPAETIYVQPIDDNDEVVQLNSSDSESQMQFNTFRQANRNNSKSSSKQNQQSSTKLQRKTRMIQQSLNNQINRDACINSSTSNYLQSYITSNRQSHKKQPSSSSNIIPLNHFQVKKHSVNETAFNYTGPSNSTQLQSNIGSISTNTNTGGQNSLSRGNSIKKMKTFCNGSGGVAGNSTIYNNSNSKQLSSNIQNSNHSHVSGFNKQTKKILHKNGKNVNMYSTLNGSNQQTHKRTQQKESLNEKNDQKNKENGFVKIVNDDQNQTTRNEKTPGQSRLNMREPLGQNNQQKLQGSLKQNFVSNQEQVLLLPKQNHERQQINNLNEIFSDFLDEQSQIQPNSQAKNKLTSKVRAESLHSRQQVLLEEDSLENTKKIPDQAYLLTEQYLSNCQDSQSLNGEQATQRAIKHMAHKSMYALNSNQVKAVNSKKSSQCSQNQQKVNNGQQQHFGTFDGSQMGLFNNYAITSMSDCANYDNMVLSENYNICNINLQSGCNERQSLRMNTDIDNKENMNHQKDQYEGLGKRGGTLGNPGYGRSDSNPTKHRVKYSQLILQNNRYSDQCDDLLMLDMSEEDSVLMKQRF